MKNHRKTTIPDSQKNSSQENFSIMGLRTSAYLEIMGGYFPELPETEQEAKEIKDILKAPDKSQLLQLREAAFRSAIFTLHDQGTLDFSLAVLPFLIPFP